MQLPTDKTNCNFVNLNLTTHQLNCRADDLLPLFTKITDNFIKLTQTKPQEFKMNEPRKPISFGKSLKLKDEWMLSLTHSEVFSCVFWVKPKKLQIEILQAWWKTWFLGKSSFSWWKCLKWFILFGRSYTNSNIGPNSFNLFKIIINENGKSRKHSEINRRINNFCFRSRCCSWESFTKT